MFDNQNAFTFKKINTYLLASIDFTLGKYYDAYIPINLNNFRHTIRIAGVINVTRQATAERCVNNAILVQAEHINTTILQRR